MKVRLWVAFMFDNKLLFRLYKNDGKYILIIIIIGPPMLGNTSIGGPII